MARHARAAAQALSVVISTPIRPADGFEFSFGKAGLLARVLSAIAFRACPWHEIASSAAYSCGGSSGLGLVAAPDSLFTAPKGRTFPMTP